MRRVAPAVALYFAIACDAGPAPPARHSAAPSPRPSISPQLREQTATYIRAHGYWCGRVEKMLLDTIKSTPNRKYFHVMCDDGRQVVNYELTTDGNFSPVGVREK